MGVIAVSKSFLLEFHPLSVVKMRGTQLDFFSVRLVSLTQLHFSNLVLSPRFGSTIFSAVLNIIFALRIRALYDQSRKGSLPNDVDFRPHLDYGSAI